MRSAVRIEASGRRTLHHPADATDRQSLDQLRDTVLSRFGRVDILVNAAGHTLKEPAVSIREKDWQSILDTDVTSVLRACQSFYEALRSSGRRRVTNIASVSSFLPFHQVAAYSASKTALLSLTRSLACEWARGNFGQRYRARRLPDGIESRADLGNAAQQRLLMRTPMARFGKPEELVGAAVLLASDGASFLTGQCIVVDGGYLASCLNS